MKLLICVCVYVINTVLTKPCVYITLYIVSIDYAVRKCTNSCGPGDEATMHMQLHIHNTVLHSRQYFLSISTQV